MGSRSRLGRSLLTAPPNPSGPLIAAHATAAEETGQGACRRGERAVHQWHGRGPTKMCDEPRRGLAQTWWARSSGVGADKGALLVRSLIGGLEVKFQSELIRARRQPTRHRCGSQLEGIQEQASMTLKIIVVTLAQGTAVARLRTCFSIPSLTFCTPNSSTEKSVRQRAHGTA